MNNQNGRDDTALIKKYIRVCSKKRMTLEQMAKAVGRTKGWASLLAQGKITRLWFCTRNRILEYLGEL